MLYRDNRKVVFTTHAFMRIKECQMTASEALEVFKNATEYKMSDLDKNLAKHVKNKYDGNVGIKYWRNGTLNFVGKEMLDNRSQEPIYLIITVTDTRVNIKY